ncbi:MAG: ferrous iron transport protein B [Clostridiales bacterium]|nr:ferrous iron transport protein B [Clostridiales bacterium]
MSRFQAVLCGNPNVGKSTVFNALTGMRQHTGNWAGKTVESARGVVRDGEKVWTLTDLPGTYSLLDGSPDELVASDYLIFGDYEVVIVVCDATCMERSLHLALQAGRLCPHTVVCVNLMDEARRRGIHIDLTQLEEQLGLPVVGVSAKHGKGIDELKQRVYEQTTLEKQEGCPSADPADAQETLRLLTEECSQCTKSSGRAVQLGLRFLCLGEKAVETIPDLAEEQRQRLCTAWAEAQEQLTVMGYTGRSLLDTIIALEYQHAHELVTSCVSRQDASARDTWQMKVDRLLCDKRVGIPIVLLLLALVFYLTLAGANVPSAWLSGVLLGFEETLADGLLAIGAPVWLVGAVAHGMYRSLAWVVSVMLPPMAIFFPLFTLLEDFGFLPRIAFNLDRCFRACHACGKQALCMCMGLGCNAVGVTGCRIIRSQRERMIAILTNAFTPCNGRLPFLVTLISMFLVAYAGAAGVILSSLALVALIVISVLVTLGASFLLSKTVLRGMPSTFTLELPPFRMPKPGEVIVRSVLDRTVFVLMRAISVAAPAGLLLWVLGNLTVGGTSLLRHGAAFLDPLGRLMGMDGVILLAFLLGMPANEIVLPIMLMTYLSQGMLIEPAQTDVLKTILLSQGWTPVTAICTALFTMFHWPCSTTVLTVRKETGHIGWTALSVLLPTAAGMVICICVASLCRLFLPF